MFIPFWLIVVVCCFFIRGFAEILLALAMLAFFGTLLLALPIAAFAILKG